MNSKQKQISVLLVAAIASWSEYARAQSGQELDLTMQVIREDEVPAGLINRIELPAPEFFNPVDQFSDLTETSIGDDTREQAGAITIELEETGTNRIREIISIDGTGINNDPSTGVTVDLPAAVTEILDDTLPLAEPIGAVDSVAADIVDALSDQAVNLLPSAEDTSVDAGAVTDMVGDTVDVVGDTVDVVGDTIDAVGDTVDVVGDTTDAVGDTIDAATDIVDNFGAAASDLTDSTLVNGVTDDVLDDTGSDIIDSLEVLDSSEPESLVEDLPDTLDSDLLENSVQGIIHNVPGFC